MATYRSPGVYVEEIASFPPSIAEVESAVPAFVGYTQKADSLSPGDLLKVPTPISSWSEYVTYFGGPEKEDGANITIAVDEQRTGTVTTGYKVTVTPNAANLRKHILYHAVKLFFANGGGKCYIVSVGDYTMAPAKADLEAGLDMVALEDVPTILAVPEAVFLASDAEFQSINSKMIDQASTLKDRFAVLDTKATTVPKTPTSIQADVDVTIASIPVGDSTRFAAVYYPWVRTAYAYEFDFDNLQLNDHKINGVDATGADNKEGPLSALKASASVLYNAIQAEYGKYTIALPPSTAIAGVYARVDRDRGVWKAPANVGLVDVVKPLITISRQEHDSLNINATSGKSVNAILSMPGFGTVVMGGRTLDGNSNDWKYINVRRFFSVVEESIKKSTNWVVFEPNTASTWTKVQAMIESYLFLKWRDGALAGPKPELAYQVNVGLGKTMNAVDILEGRMIIEIRMAVARPGEFIILQFIQIMQSA
ncbi:MAG TPA: phage tail sheath C-terminal domain-containing protein [Chitinophaga sp.]|uniref:phage tail sheath family protein n=1 Tax=Chitinophaga sp. TaxID=1869181 RepID=UPI002DBCC508|nr:phage tail sheath C-terminal domain-containing protein [Chitinophaga sp.]HEU4553916.1 phage tail sheath C-terminal domain-containing protein [Chitinophaga sp.]